MTVHITAIRRWTKDDFSQAVETFSARYRRDWDSWLQTPPRAKAVEFGRILRSWQATRPRTMRRTREEDRHTAPFLEDLLGAAPIADLGDLNVTGVRGRTPGQDEALRVIWETFRQLPVDGLASAVGITKAIMLATNGRIRPGLDSNVQRAIGVRVPKTADAWIEILEGISDDISAFVSMNGPLEECVGPDFQSYASARLYDMALGPRSSGRTVGLSPETSSASRSVRGRVSPGHDGVSDASSFSVRWYQDRSFEGFVPVSDLRRSLDVVPNAPGVYVVLRTATPPIFRARSTGGWFKDRDPTVDRRILRARWHPDTPTLYVGKADSLRPRVRALIRFGTGEPVGHWGGRYVWQLADAESLIVAWRPQAQPRAFEAALLAEFAERFGSLPFANISA